MRRTSSLDSDWHHPSLWLIWKPRFFKLFIRVDCGGEEAMERTINMVRRIGQMRRENPATDAQSMFFKSDDTEFGELLATMTLEAAGGSASLQQHRRD